MKLLKILLTASFVIAISFLFSITGIAEENGPTYPIPPQEKPDNFLDIFQYPDDYLNIESQLEVIESPITPRIVGGSTYTPQNLYPWIASLQFSGIHYCGGTLISPSWILTAAHCWVDNSGIPYAPSSLDKVILGEYDRSTTSGNEQEIGIDEVFIHPSYDHTSLSYDVALLKLDTPASINDYVAPVQLVLSNAGSMFDQASTILGWGAQTYEGPSVDVIRYANISILNDSLCASAYGPWYLTTSMLCAGTTDGSKDSCQGDSGGPLVIDDNGTWKQAGVVSWGYECGVEGYPGVYTRISAVSSWIRTTSKISPSPANDYDNDWMSDPAKFYESTNTIWWLKSSTSTWDSAWLGDGSFDYTPRSDFDGDDITDPGKYDAATGTVWYIKSSDSSWEGKYLGVDSYTYQSGNDFDGDGKTDPTKLLPDGAIWYMESGSADAWQGFWLGAETFEVVNNSDFDGDGKTDPAKFVSATGVLWYWSSESSGWVGVYLGPGSYSFVGGSDFDGDGKTDPAQFDSSNVLWYVKSSDSSLGSIWMGSGTFIFIGGNDFDGDGITDPAKYDPVTGILSWIKSSTINWDSADMGLDAYQIVN